MRATKGAFFMRGGAACAAAAVLFGGTFAASTATAAPSLDTAPSSIAMATSTAQATPSAAGTALPGGLAQAVKRDLGMSVEEFNAQGELATQGATIQAELRKVDPEVKVSLDADTINVQTSAEDLATSVAKDVDVHANVTAVKATSSFATAEASSIDAVYAEFVKTFGVTNLQSIMINGAGEIVIRTAGGPAVSALSAAAASPIGAFAAKYTNVQVEAAAGPASSFAGEITNGQGYVALNSTTGQGEICSTGWNGFNKSGAPAIISAGHCTLDGLLDAAIRTNPLADEAATGTPGVQPVAQLGVFGFSQFGGPNNSRASDTGAATPGNIGTDVSTINVTEPDLSQPAKVTDWTTPANPASSGPVVTDVSTAIVGAPICKSGRTTGWSCGVVASEAIFLVAGKDYPGDLTDVRAVRGFSSTNLKTNHGDSGGPVISGTAAVGMISAGDETGTVFGVDLEDALAHTDGYTVKILLEAPKLTTNAPVYRQGAVTGTLTDAPPGTTVSVTIDGNTTEVAVGPDGTWSASAPNKFGSFAVTAQAKNGFSTSEITTASIEVIKETLPAPVITSPADGSSVGAPLTTITGTGTPGATIKLSKNVTGTVTVGGDGTWRFTLPRALDDLGGYTVTAKQTLTDWNDSPETTSGFTVAPDAPAITSPSNGQTFLFNEGPSVISGTNVQGAGVRITMNGKPYNAVVEGTTWSIRLDAPLTTGNYAITAVQQLGDFQSLTGTFAFVVQAQPQPEHTTPPVTQAPTAPALTPAATNNDLARTGASGSTLLLGVASGLLVLGGGVFIIFRRRSSK